MTTKRLASRSIVLLTLALLPAALAGDFAIDWYTVDAGGGFSSGGDFELEGAIAQHDAGPSTGAMTGGDFELTGGFWVVAAATSDPCAAFLCGDANCDATFDGADIDAFFVALGDPPAWDATYPDCDRVCVADINGDNTVDGADIDAFFAALGDGACP